MMFLSRSCNRFKREEKILKKAIAIGLLCIAGAAGAAPTPPVPSGTSAALPLVLSGHTPLPKYTGDFDHLYADVKNDRLILCAEDHGTLEVFNLRSGAHLRTVHGFETPHSIFAVPGKEELLVTDGSETIKRLDARTLATIGTIKLHPGADSIGFDSSTGHLFIVTGGKDVKLADSWLEEIEPQTGKLLGTVHFDANHVEALAVEQHGPHIFINVTDKNEVDVIDKNSLKIVAKWPIHESKQNASVAFDESTHRLFIVARVPGKMIVLNSDTGATVASFEAPGHVDGVTFDAANRRAYATGGDGWIGAYQEIDADHFAELPRVTSAEGAKTSVLVPELHRLYVGVSPGERHSGGEVRWFDVVPATH